MPMSVEESSENNYTQQFRAIIRQFTTHCRVRMKWDNWGILINVFIQKSIKESAKENFII